MDNTNKLLNQSNDVVAAASKEGVNITKSSPHNLCTEKNLEKLNEKSPIVRDPENKTQKSLLKKKDAFLWVKYALSGIGAKDIDAEQVSVNKLKKQIDRHEFDNRPVFEYFGGTEQGLEQIVHPYFDLDVDFETDNKPPFNPILQQAEEFIMKEFNCPKQDLMLSFAHRIDKWSCHIIIPSMKTAISNLVSWKDSHKTELSKLHLDPAVYRKGSFRVVGTSKKGFNTPLLMQNGDFNDHLITLLNGLEKDWINISTSQKSIKPKIEIKKQPIRRISDTEFKEAQLLTKCLKNNVEMIGFGDTLDHTKNYDEWIKIGLCLHNLDLNLLDDWIKFSKLSTKYNEDYTIKQWNSFKFSEQGLSISSLHQWAKEDNPLGYRNLFHPKENLLKDVMEYSQPNGHIDFSLMSTFKKTETDDSGNEAKVNDISRGIIYLNQYLIFINHSSPAQLIEFTDQDKRGFLIRKVAGLEKTTYSPIKNFFKCWLASPIRREVSRIVFKPYLQQRPRDFNGEFNLFHGFKFPYDPHFQVSIEKIQIWLDYILHLWCNNDQSLYQYVLSWFSHKVQFPEKKIGVSLICKSILQGAGKNTLFNFFTKNVIGSEYGNQIGNADDLFERFNGEFEHSLLVCCDEIGHQGAMYKNADKLKALITRELINIEEKGVEKKLNCPDYNDYMMFSNNDWIIKAESSDRRNCCLELSNAQVGEFDYWNKIYGQMNDDVGMHFFHYLANYDLSDVNIKKIPMTEWKRELKERSYDPIMKMLLQFVNQRLKIQCNDKTFLVSEFYDQLGEMKDPPTPRALSVKLSKILNVQSETNKIRKNNKFGRGYSITLPQIIERLRKVLCDPLLFTDKVDDDDWKDKVISDDDPNFLKDDH